MPRMGTPYGYLEDAALQAKPALVEPGHSGYFSSPSATLDPHLFDGDRIKPDVRDELLILLYDFWSRKYRSAHVWSTVWLAGSGISYQWSGDRGNGDLDVLIGVDPVLFTRYNPEYSGLAESDIDTILTNELRTNLWPATSSTNLHGQIYEVTYYVNLGAEDIRAIHPYAAYNLSDNSWTARPPELPQDPETLYPDSWRRAAQDEIDQANEIVADYNRLRADIGSSQMRAYTLGGQLQHVVARAQHMADDIHTGRRQAFATGGQGYGDWYNYRWQVHKRAGTFGALHEIATVLDEANRSRDAELYGGSIAPADEALRTAALWHRGGPR